MLYKFQRTLQSLFVNSTRSQRGLRTQSASVVFIIAEQYEVKYQFQILKYYIIVTTKRAVTFIVFAKSFVSLKMKPTWLADYEEKIEYQVNIKKILNFLIFIAVFAGILCTNRITCDLLVCINLVKSRT